MARDKCWLSWCDEDGPHTPSDPRYSRRPLCLRHALVAQATGIEMGMAQSVFFAFGRYLGTAEFG